MKRLTFIIAVFITCLTVYSQSQSDKDKAEKLFYDGIDYMHSGYIDKSIELLEEACELDPKNVVYPYELSYAYYLNEDYDEVIEILQKLKKHKDADHLVYELLGNAYDMKGRTKRSIEIYYQGLRRFPKSARLYFEIGVTYGRKNKLDSAVKNWEKAIEADPGFSSPYYQLAHLFSYTTEKIWTLIYGELFMNLERKTKRTLEISKLMYDVYKNNISYNGDKISVQFSKVSMPGTMGFSVSYELITTLSLIKLEKKVSISYLNKLRTNFSNIWDSSKPAEKYDVALFKWHKKLIDNGYFDAYNYWLFNAGNPEEFKKWHKENETKFSEFDAWMGANGLIIDSTNYFVRKKIKEDPKY